MTDATTGDIEDYDAVRAERDELKARLEANEHGTHQAHRTRRIFSVFFVILATLAFLVAMPGLWANRNLLNTDRFVTRVAPLVNDPDVQEVLTTRITDQVMTLVDPRALFEQVLPERGQVLAAPLSNAVKGFVRNTVEAFVGSAAFERLWVGSARIAHETAMKVLSGKSEAVTTSNGQVTLNLIPVINEVLKRITSQSPEILGRKVNLPDVSVNEIPKSAINRIEKALGVDLPDNFGQITVYDHGKLEAAQQALRTFSRIVVLLLPLAIVSALLAVWLSVRRRRTVLQLAAGAALAAVVVRRVIFAIEAEVAALPPTAAGRRAITAVLASFLTPLTTFGAWTLAIAAVVAVVALLTGPYPWAVAARTRGVSLARSFASSASATAHDQATQRWVHDHRDLLAILGCVVGVVILWLANMSWLGVLITLIVVGAYLFVLFRIAGSAQLATDAPSDGPKPHGGA